jgi:ADP-ribose pyrophosphatase
VSDGRRFRHLGDELRDRGWRIELVTASFAGPDGARFTRDVVRHPGAVAVVPVTDAGTAVLVRQYRGALDAELLEIPAGTCDVPGEAAEETATRELAEEVGLRAGALEPLVTFANSPGFCDQRTTVFLATELERCDTARDGPEERAMSVHELPLESVDEAIADGRIVDGQTLIGLLLARQRWHTRSGACGGRP